MKKESVRHIVKGLAYSVDYIRKGAFLSGHSGGGQAKEAPTDGLLVTFSVADLPKNSASPEFQQSVFLPMSMLPVAPTLRELTVAAITEQVPVDTVELMRCIRAFADGKRKRAKHNKPARRKPVLLAFMRRTKKFANGSLRIEARNGK